MMSTHVDPSLPGEESGAGGSDALRRRLLEEMLCHVPFDGWSPAALARAAAALGLDSGAAKLAFPGGIAEMIAFFSETGDERMVQTLALVPDWSSLKVRERITRAVRCRLEGETAHRDAVRRAMAFLVLPGYGELAPAMMYRTVDAMWRACGDRSTDFNFYTKRAILAGVFGATLMVWLGDESDGFADTWRFLDHRIADVMRFEKLKGDVRRITDRFPDPLGVLARLRYPF